jgi:hypothetical protein
VFEGPGVNRGLFFFGFHRFEDDFTDFGAQMFADVFDEADVE